MNNVPRHTHPEDTSELLSSYLDGAPDIAERRRTEAFLQSCQACSTDLADLRSIRSLLRELPAPVPPRSFTLDQSVARPRLRLFPIFRSASLVAALLLVVVLGVDMLGRGSRMAATTALAPVADQTGGGPAPESGLSLRSAATPAPAAAAPPPQGAAEAGGGAAAAATTGAAAGEAALAPAQAEATAAAAGAAAGGSALTGTTVTAAGEAAQTTGQAAATTEAAAGAAGGATGTEVGATAADALQSVPTPEALQTPAPQEEIAANEAYPAPVEELSKTDSSSVGTSTLDQPTLSPEQTARPRTANPWRVLEYLLAALVLFLGSAAWWTARRQL